MKIFVLTKRQYMGKDLLDDRFGRFRELPLELARRGHHVSGLALSYRHRSEAIVKDTDEHRSASVLWHSVNLVTKIPSGPLAYWNTARKLIRDFQPDLVWAGSDAYHAWLKGAPLARCMELGMRCGRSSLRCMGGIEGQLAGEGQELY